MNSSFPAITEIHQFLAKHNRSNACLIAVTKKHPASTIQQLLVSKQFHLGENRKDDFFAKVSNLSPEQKSKAIFHYLAPLQTRQIRHLIPHFHYLHSVSSHKHITKLMEAVQNYKLTQNDPQYKLRYFIQIKLTNESTKQGGIGPQEIRSWQEFPENKSLEFMGFMTMGPQNKDEKETRKVFSTLRNLRDELIPHKFLSMGTSQDWKIAIEEGSDFLRVGQFLFSI